MCIYIMKHPIYVFFLYFILRSHLLYRQYYVLKNTNIILQELPEQWESLKKQCDLIRQHVAPLKASEVSAIRKKCVKFETRQAIYREKFKKYSFFK